MNRSPELSVVIPVFNEEQRIQRGLTSVTKYLAKQKFSWEIIVVDDGSTDKTKALARKLLNGSKNSQIISSNHLGKGGAIKQGILKARGKWVLFMDIDLATPIEELAKFREFKDKFDAIIGSRKMKGAQIEIHQPKFREFGGKIFTFLTNLVVTRGISDITCGFKMFKTKIAKNLFKKSKNVDWSFDAEILFLAQKQGVSIKEVPVVWRDDPQTRVNLLRDTLDSFFGLVKIRVNDLLGKY